MMYVALMKNFLLIDSSELMVVRLISTSWAKKRLIFTFLTWYTSSWWKIFFSMIRANFWLLDTFPASRAQKRLIPTFWTRCTSCAWKIFFSPIGASWWLLDLFRPPEPKNDWFLLSRPDVRRVDEKFSSRRFGRADGVRLISASWGQIRLILTFWTWFTSSWWKMFFSPIRASWWLLDSFRPPEPKNVWFLLSRPDVRRDDEKFSSRRFERAFDC